MTRKNLQSAEEIASSTDDFFSVKPFLTPNTGIVITGNEVFSGLIDDKFAPIIRNKLQAFDCDIIGIAFAPDHRQQIVSEIGKFLQDGAEMIVVAGGMSVDPDDITRVAIADAGVEDVVYGTPVLPGAMFYMDVSEISRSWDCRPVFFFIGPRFSTLFYPGSWQEKRLRGKTLRQWPTGECAWIATSVIFPSVHLENKSEILM